MFTDLVLTVSGLASAVVAPSSAPSSFALTNDSGSDGTDGITNVQPAVSWSADATATSYETSTDGTSWTDVGNVTTYTFSGLSNGAKTLQVRSKNSAGTGPAASRSITLDTVAPSSTSWISTSPSLKSTAYTNLEVSLGENISGGTITSVTSSSGGVIANKTINGS